MRSPQNHGWWGLCLCLSSQHSGLSELWSRAGSQAVQCSGQGLWEWAAVGAAEFFRPLGMSRNVLGVPGTVMSGSRGAPVLYLICSLLSIVSHMKLKQVEVPDAWPCLCLPRVCHLWMLLKMAVGGWSVLPRAVLPAVAVPGTLSLPAVSVEAREAGWSQPELLLFQPCSSRVWGCLPGAWVGSLTDACMVPWPSSSSESLQWPLLRHVCWKGPISCVYSFLSPAFQLLPGILGLFLAALHMCLVENLVTV